MKKILILFGILLLSGISIAQNVFQNIPNRKTTTLNGKWHYIVDVYESGYYNYRYEPRDQKEHPTNEAIFLDLKPNDRSDLHEYDFDTSPTLYVPGDWNSQEENLFYYEGTVWYRKTFDYKKENATNRIFLNFGAVNYRADIYLNGIKLGFHEGGFTPFYFEVTNLLKEKDNSLVVKVDNKRKKEAVPTLNTDWWNYGGITRDVDLIETQSTYIADYSIQLQKGNAGLIEGYISLNGDDKANQQVAISIPELKINQTLTTNSEGIVSVAIKAKNISYWSPENPKLYTINLKYGNHTLNDKIGFRTIEVKGSDILLNNKSVYLRGISIHEENPLGGRRAYCKEDAELLLGWAKELGCNFVRLAHYPHNEHMLRMADEMGILVWEENPVYWTIPFENHDTYLLAEKQLKEVMMRDKNRASVIIWSMANETPRSEVRLEFLRNLAATARNLDNTRLISAALEKNRVEGKENTLGIDDPFMDYVDIISFNEYVGWYDGLPEKCERVQWEINYNKPVFISEYGGGALQGLHGDKLDRWSEEFQEDLYIKNIAMLRQIPQLRGMSPWILADFRSPRRMRPVIQDGWNRKGLISEKGTKKKAFFVLQEYYKEMMDKWSK
ncbi:glycoside hydrolase family 2 protein [Carboxylicivirga caseinilyticus]|uniref:glycoside hydrolase family 2 protein n=1 Tax=Carboxylicivirga caseinilyticus TaxID=3417572 RepID=UPI003D359664|nr:beta galactosidase jelly roll domain-containing protein [Marinilabiliaceae bacterium A049]